MSKRKYISFLMGKWSTLTLSIPDAHERHELCKRLRRIINDERTHVIEIYNRQIAHKELPIESKLELNVWDFAGQHEYYNNHHHFLSARSIFLVVWKVTEEHDTQLGLSGLEFWLKSLKAHLPRPTEAMTIVKPLYTIIIVGTHIDQVPGNPEESRGFREQKVKALFDVTCEMGHLPFEYVEVLQVGYEHG